MKDLYELPIPDYARGFYDPKKTHQWAINYAVKGFEQALNKIETNDYKLKVTDIHIPDEGKTYSLHDQKNAVMNKEDLTLPIKGTFQLINKKTGEVVDEKKTTIAHLPYTTSRNTHILNGAEMLVTAQQRLRPGVYTRVKESGEMEAHVNVQSGTGVGGRVIFHAEKALFVYEVGTTQIKLYGVLHDLGMSDQQMKDAWGEEILQKNKAAYDGKEIEKLYAKIFKYDKD